MDAVTAVITTLGVELPNVPRVAALVRRELTVAPLSLNDPFPKKFKVYLESPTRFVVPLHWARAALAPFQPRWRDARGAGEDARLDFKGSLRPSLRQPEAVRAVLDSWDACGGAMLCLPVGFGKTLCALYLASVVKKKTLVLVHKAFLKDQWVERVGEFLPGARVTEVQGDVCDTSGDVVVAMIQTLVSRKYPPATFAACGVVIFDECFPYRQKIATSEGACDIGAVFARWKAGETVMVHSFDEITRTFAVKPVTHAWQKRAAEELVEVKYSKSGFKSTPNHRVLTPEGWRCAGDLRGGDLLISRYDTSLKEVAVAKAMNDDQYQVFLGSLLGDGCLQGLPSGRYRLAVTHGQCQREYCEWKAGMFGAGLSEFVGGYKSAVEVRFATTVIDLPAHKPFPAGKKTWCPQWVLDELEDRGLAIWFMDDASVNGSGGITIHTNTFDEASHVRICARLKAMGFDAGYGLSTKQDGRSFYYVKMGQESGMALLARVAPYVHRGMAYKLSNLNSQKFATVQEKADLQMYDVEGVQYVWNAACPKCDAAAFHRVSYSVKNGNASTRCPRRRQVVDIPDVADIGTYRWNSGYLDYGTLRVASVRRFKPEDTRVYDIEVEGTHTFVCCSIGGIGPVVHNCHHVAAQAFSRSMWGLCAPRVLGLSATPERKDGLVRVVSWFAGPIAFRVRRENQDTTRVKVVKYSCAEFDGPPPVNRRGDVCFTTVVTRLAENAHRSLGVAREVGDLAAQGRDVLVLTHRRQHAKDLAEAIAALGVDVGTYMGGDKRAPDTKVIVATYALTSEGFDLPRLNALVLATPASDVEQSCGRVMRGSSTRGAVIVDWVDQWGVCFSQHAKRRGFYKRSGFSMDPGQGRGEEEQAAPPQEFAFVNDDG